MSHYVLEIKLSYLIKHYLYVSDALTIILDGRLTSYQQSSRGLLVCIYVLLPHLVLTVIQQQVSAFDTIDHVNLFDVLNKIHRF